MSNAMIKILELHNVTKTYPGVIALDSVSFDLYRGEIHCLVGENGAGKSTLIKILSGATAPDNGTIQIFEKKYDRLDPHTAMEHGVRTVYQEANLIDSLSVAENIYIGYEKTNGYGFFSNKNTQKAAAELLGFLNIHVDINSLVEKLSVSEKQLIKIAKMFALEASILILDEPTTSLNENEIKNLLSIIVKLKNENLGIIYISHKLEEVFQIADRISILRDGRKINTHHVNNVTAEKLINEMVGKTSESFYKKEKCVQSDESIRVEDYQIMKDTKPISFNVRHGEVLMVFDIKEK